MAERVGISPVMETANAESASERAPRTERANRGVDRFLRLQQSIGNRATQSLLRSDLLQRKLRVGPVNSVNERGQVPIQRKCAECEEEEKKEQGTLQRKPRSSGPSPVRSIGGSRVSSLRGVGRPLPPPARSFSEQRFSHHFSQAPVHYGSFGVIQPKPTSRQSGDTSAREADERAESVLRMPDPLKTGLETLSGMDLSDVRVHKNSSKPAKLNAFAYTQGQDIHLGQGQEKHLPHEGWHVVQQMQGRVKPTMQAKGVSMNDDAGLEREADVMGAKARQLAGEARAADFHTRIATAGGGGLDDEPYVVATRATAQAVTRQTVTPAISTSNVPVIQRAANFVAGTVNATTNLASHLIAGRRDGGFTPPTLNGTTILSAVAAQGAIKAPTLGGRSTGAGTSESWVNAVATNEASFTMQVPSGGPWSTVTTKANVAALFASLRLTAQAGCSTAGGSTFSVNGKPSDADFAANARTHEDLHVADHKTGFSAVIVAWDTKLQAAQKAKTVFSGATVADSEAALFKAMSGTPDQIATAQHNKWIALNNATHAAGTTAATGGVATASNSAANATCTTSSLDLT